MKPLYPCFALLLLSSCYSKNQIHFSTIDTDFSKGRLANIQKIRLRDLERLHGHLCDGLLLGALAMQEIANRLYPNQPIDRTNLRIVSQASPCLTDVAMYITGGRTQFNTFYIDTLSNAIYIVQRMDNLNTFKISLKKGVKPPEIDSLGKLSIQKKLSPCGIDSLRILEDAFAQKLLKTIPSDIFTIEEIPTFSWSPYPIHKLIKTDIINKALPPCK